MIFAWRGKGERKRGKKRNSQLKNVISKGTDND